LFQPPPADGPVSPGSPDDRMRHEPRRILDDRPRVFAHRGTGGSAGSNPRAEHGVIAVEHRERCDGLQDHRLLAVAVRIPTPPVTSPSGSGQLRVTALSPAGRAFLPIAIAEPRREIVGAHVPWAPSSPMAARESTANITTALRSKRTHFLSCQMRTLISALHAVTAGEKVKADIFHLPSKCGVTPTIVSTREISIGRHQGNVARAGRLVYWCIRTASGVRGWGG
jgi:hypothetical protein